MGLFGSGEKKEMAANAKADKPAANSSANAEQGEKQSSAPQKPDEEMTLEQRYEKGMELFRAGDYDGAFPLLKRVCPVWGIRINKYPDGQAALGWMYEHGNGTEVNDSDAFLHYKIAARNGDRDSKVAVVRLTAENVAPYVDTCQTALDYAEELNIPELTALVPTLKAKLADAQAREEEKNREKQREAFQAAMAAGRAGEYQKAQELFQKAAELGSVDAMFNLGEMYYTSEDTAVDRAKAFYWYEKAAQQGHSTAQFNTAVMCYTGKGTEKNLEKAAEWAQKAAEQGDKKAGSLVMEIKLEQDSELLVQRGLLFYEEKEYEKALETFLEAAERGAAKAQFKLGAMYYNGEGTAVDKAKAFYWYDKAAQQGYADAQYNLALMYYNGEGTEKNLKKAAEWAQKARVQGDYNAGLLVIKIKIEQNPELLVKSGLLYCEKKEYEKALETFLKAAELGARNAQFKLGVMYYNGEGTEKDLSKAVYWYEKAAQQGYADAQYNLALMYYNGEGTAADEAKAFYWYEKAAQQGQALAQFNLAVMYYNGEGTAVDEAKAETWLRKAAAQTKNLKVQAMAKDYLRECF